MLPNPGPAIAHSAPKIVLEQNLLRTKATRKTAGGSDYRTQTLHTSTGHRISSLLRNSKTISGPGPFAPTSSTLLRSAGFCPLGTFTQRRYCPGLGQKLALAMGQGLDQERLADQGFREAREFPLDQDSVQAQPENLEGFYLSGFVLAANRLEKD